MSKHDDVLAALATAAPDNTPRGGALDWDLNDFQFDQLFDEPDPDVDVAQLTEFEISKLLRGVRSRKREVERLEAYKKKLVEQIENTVGAKIKRVEEESELRRNAIRTWLERNNKKGISFPDIGRLTATEKIEFTYNEEEIFKYLKANGKSQFIKSKEALDKTAFKKMVEAENIVVPGFVLDVKKSTTFTEA
jgi:phage host-nuclease inhibitor protein Gam